MKTMTCRQLGGACDQTFHANTFDEMASLSRQHGTEMYEQRDHAHVVAMQEMQSMMQQPGAVQAWMDEKKKLFDSLPDD